MHYMHYKVLPTLYVTTEGYHHRIQFKHALYFFPQSVSLSAIFFRNICVALNVNVYVPNHLNIVECITALRATLSPSAVL